MGIKSIKGSACPPWCRRGKGYLTPWLYHQLYESKTSLKSTTQSPLCHDCLCPFLPHRDFLSVCLSVSICLCFCLFNFCLQYVSLHRVPSFKRVNTKRPSRKGKTLLPGDKSILHGARNSLESNQVTQEWSWSPKAQPRKDSHRKSQHQHRPEPDPNRELIQESGRDFKTNEEVKEETKANATEMSKSCRKSGWTDSTCAPQERLANA